MTNVDLFKKAMKIQKEVNEIQKRINTEQMELQAKLEEIDLIVEATGVAPQVAQRLIKNYYFF